MPTDLRLQKLERIAANRQRDFVLVLENIHDPHNAAAICRSADSVGIQEIWLICETVARWDLFELGKKSSAFTSRWITFRHFETTAACLAELRTQSFQVWATMLDNEAESLTEANFTAIEKIALIMGNEHQGISEAMQKATDKKLYIPMNGFAQSLNVSVATALCLWEIYRQREQSDIDFRLDQEGQAKLIEKFCEKQQEKKNRKREKKRKGVNKKSQK